MTEMAIREIVLDTETTGLDPQTGDRLVELGCIELFNSLPTGETFHRYIDPERDMPAEAFRVHGLSREFLTGKPKFAEIAEEFLAFIGDARLVIHNAEFDMKFLNAELKRAGLAPLTFERVIDTLSLARRKHPGAPNSLDALCARYGIDNSRRTKHGALLDSEILAEVYLELSGGRQAALQLATVAIEKVEIITTEIVKVREIAIPSQLDELEWGAHSKFVASMGEKAVWRKYT
jgi:DNA polymerase-3 subunit epsilon